MKKLLPIIFVFSSVLIFSSCGSNKESEESTKDTVALVKDTAAEIREFKFFMILANIPSPAREVIEIQKASMKYDATLLNPKENESKYSEKTKVCLNYGIYATDLAYIASFKDNQDLMSYFLVNRKMAEKAGALSVFEEIMKKENFESNIKNTDSLEKMLDDVFMATEKFCEDQHKLDIAVKILIGSWVEGQYLNLSMIKSQAQNPKNKKLFEKVWENFLHLRNINDLLKEYEGHPELDELKTQLVAYAELYKDAHGTEDINKERIARLYEAMALIRANVVK
ncbi:MAG: hypothetical protein ACK5AY_09840 [Bacteroidota bacterium]